MIFHPKESMDQKINITLWSSIFFLCAFTVSTADRQRPQGIITQKSIDAFFGKYCHDAETKKSDLK